MAHNRNLKKLRFTKEQQLRHLRIEIILLVIVLGIAIAVMYRHYKDYPSIIDNESLKVSDKGVSFIGLEWGASRNTDSYRVYYKVAEIDEDGNEKDDVIYDSTERDSDGSVNPWKMLKTTNTDMKVEGLNEGTKYSFAIVSENLGRRSGASEIKSVTTQKKQKIKADENVVKFTSSKPFKLDVEAKTELKYSTSDEEVLTIDKKTGEVTITGSGKAEVKVTAEESGSYTSAKKTIEVSVYDVEPRPISGSGVHIIHYLDPDNCDRQFQVTGAGGAVAPQGLAYTGDKYMITFGQYGPTRIVSYDLDGSDKSVEVPKNSLGHPNGFTYSPDSGRCYCVRGRSSTCVIYDTKSGEYKTITMPTGCSGVSYDRVRKTLCTSARRSIIAYDPDTYETIKRYGVVSHSGTVYRQDCECYDGIMMAIVSGSNRHGTNYIDMYDMDEGTYLGSLQCNLSEVESIIVNDEGFLVILANGTSRADYIWNTDVNIKALAEELRRGKA